MRLIGQFEAVEIVSGATGAIQMYWNTP